MNNLCDHSEVYIKYSFIRQKRISKLKLKKRLINI